MSTITYLTSLVQQAIQRLNNYEANAKKVDELPHQTTLEPTSKIPVSRAGISEHLTIQQIISSIQNSNYNQLLAVGTITVDGTDITVPSGVSGQINGLLYGTSTDTILSITLCPTGFSRKDIIVLTTANTVVVISGEETDGAIVLAPPVPTDALYITEFDVNDTVIGTPIDPTLGSQFKKKSENSSLKITATGEEQIINLSLGGQMHYIVTSSALISVAGFSPHLLNMGGNPLYPGQDLIFENQTGNPVTLINAHTIAPIKFNEGADIIVPNGGKIWFRINEEFAKIIMKSWSEVDLSTKLDKDTTAGVERVYTINPDGSQETKPTSDFGGDTFTLTFNTGNKTWALNTWYQQNSASGFNISGTNTYGTGAVPTSAVHQNGSWLQIPSGYIIDKITFGIQNTGGITDQRHGTEIYITRGEVTAEQVGNAQTSLETLVHETVSATITASNPKFLKDLTIASHLAKDLSILQVIMRNTSATTNLTYNVLMNITFKKA